MRLFSVLAALLLVAGLVGCDSDGTSPANDPNPDSFNTDSFAIVDSEDAFANLEDATLETEMAMKSAFHQGDGDFDRHHMHPRGPGSHLAPALFRLGLDIDQLRQLRAIVHDHRLLVHESFKGLRDANMALIEQANIGRRAIVDAYKAEEITREEAWAQIRALNERTREAIRNNPANDEFLQQICEDRVQLFEDIRSILTGDQVGEWDAWVASLDNDCINPA
jgi:hypothetical protein